MSKNIVRNFKDIPKARYVFLSVDLVEADEATGENVEGSIVYKVRGLTPRETERVFEIASLPEAPVPPTKKRQAAPLDIGGKLDASSLGLKEDYLDENDPTYKQEFEIYSDEMRLAEQRISAYRYMMCVDGFDIPDEDIKEALGDDAHPKEPLEELVLRLDQLSEIIMPTFHNAHHLALTKKITELSGVKVEQLNFT